jgi:putative transposase
MGRFTRVVAVDVPHHVTQRGNGRRFVLDGDAYRTIYLKLLHENIVLCGVALIGYCLMSNHIHLIAIPHKVDALAQALKQTHGRYASYWNAAHHFEQSPSSANHKSQTSFGVEWSVVIGSRRMARSAGT